MASLLAAALLVGFWLLLSGGRRLGRPDTRDGCAWRSGRSVASWPRRLFD